MQGIVALMRVKGPPTDAHSTGIRVKLKKTESAGEKACSWTPNEPNLRLCYTWFPKQAQNCQVAFSECFVSDTCHQCLESKGIWGRHTHHTLCHQDHGQKHCSKPFWQSVRWWNLVVCLLQLANLCQKSYQKRNWNHPVQMCPLWNFSCRQTDHHCYTQQSFTELKDIVSTFLLYHDTKKTPVMHGLVWQGKLSWHPDASHVPLW